MTPTHPCGVRQKISRGQHPWRSTKQRIAFATTEGATGNNGLAAGEVDASIDMRPLHGADRKPFERIHFCGGPGPSYGLIVWPGRSEMDARSLHHCRRKEAR